MLYNPTWHESPTSPAPDLRKPSLAGLSYLLRHRELWPAGFSWNFSGCHSCAMGLAHRTWANSLWRRFTTGLRYPDAPSMQRVFGISEHNTLQFFYYGYDTASVTPEMVADKIDAYLAGRPA